MGSQGRPAGPETRIRPQIQDLAVETIAELARRAAGRPNGIALWYGESDLPAPAPVRDAAKAALDAGRTFYVADMRGNAEIVPALAAYQTRLHGRPIGEDRSTVTPGGMQAIVLAMELLVDAGQNVVVIEPQWPNVASAVHMVGGEPRPVPMALGPAGWQLDLQRVIDRCDARTRAIALSTPCNPTGWTASRAELAALLDLSRRHGLWIVCDEVYARLYFGGDEAAPSLMALAEPDDLVLCANSFSKAWAMTGFRLGWLTHPPALSPRVAAMTQYLNSGVADFVQAAGAVALRDGEPFVATMRERCRLGVARAQAALARLPGVRLPPEPAGGMYVFFGLDGEPDSRAASLRILERTGVGLSPGALFGRSGEGFLRMCVARDPGELDTALRQIAAALGTAPDAGQGEAR